MSVLNVFRKHWLLCSIAGAVVAFNCWALWFYSTYCGKINKQPLAEYACEVEFDDYSWSLLKNTCDFLCSPFGRGRCLGFTKGNYAAHNLDWLMLDEVETIVRVKGNNKRQESISVSSCNPFFKKSQIDDPGMGLTTALLPGMAVDGINASGVFVCVNVAPKGEGYSDVSKWNYGEITTTGTNPEASERVSDILLVRYLLDHATSACNQGDPTSAWNLVNKVNWYGSTSNVMNEEFHWLVADADSSFVLEFIDNKPVKLSGEKIMSNFYLGVNNSYQPHGEGYERYDIVKQHYDSMESFKDVKHVLEEAQYSKCYYYSADDTLHFRYSDFWLQKPVGEPDSAFVAYCDSLIRDEIDIPDRDPDCKRWGTRHSAIYNLKERSLSVSFDEGSYYVERKL